MEKQRNVFIDNIPLEEAVIAYRDKLSLQPRFEEIRTIDSYGRITAQAVFAKRSSPHYHCAAMDGIVVRSTDTYGATEKNPITLREGVDFSYINTGNPIPCDKDSVIMIEDIKPIEAGQIQIIASAYPWQHVRPVGEDIVENEMIIASNHEIRAVDIGALLAAGVTKVMVYQIPLVGILPTGNEITRDFHESQVGKIVDSNSYMFQAMVTELGGKGIVYEPVEDDPDLLRIAIEKGVEENDIFIMNAGSSAGSKDYSVDLIRNLGEVFIHGIAIKPGKPTILGIIKGKPVLGIPGYPVSAFISFRTFVGPLISELLGIHLSDEKSEDQYVEAYLSRRLMSSLKYEEFVRVTIGKVKGRLVATPLNRGAGNTMSLVRADGIVRIDQQVEGVEANEKVFVELLKPKRQIEERLVILGSHDVVLDLIGDRMPISSGHVGSLGGIMALKKRECHIAPIHLLDESTGEYNDSYVKKFFPKDKMAIISGFKRLQGLMVEKGNPKQIHTFEDLVRDDVVFANRQRGSGTRQLLDFELGKRELDKDRILGYEREFTTHMSVAVAVQSKAADVGLGIKAAADSMNLDFIPIGFEAYEFLLYEEDMQEPLVIEFIHQLMSLQFQNQVLQFGGYELDQTGSVRRVGD